MTDPTDLGWTDTMLRTAADWPVEEATFVWRGPKRHPDGSVTAEKHQQPGWRCARPDCRCRIFSADDQPPSPPYIAHHMVTHHGYRMDGRHESEQAC